MSIFSRTLTFLSLFLFITIVACSDGSSHPRPNNTQLSPLDVDLTLQVGEQETLILTADLPTVEELGADVMILFDRSGSFGDDLETFVRESAEILDALSASLPDLRIGLASFVDAPCSVFGDPRVGDFGYELNLPLTGGKMNELATIFREALLKLDIRSGLDGPESQLEAIRQALTGTGLVVDSDTSPSCAGAADIAPTRPGFDRERLRFLIVSTDDAFHRPTDIGYPYPTGVDDVVAVASQEGATLFFLDSGFTDAAAVEIAEATRGDVFLLSSASEEVVEAIDDAISTAIREVEVRVEATAEGAQFIADIQPPFQIRNLLTDDTAEFEVTFFNDLARATFEREFSFELVFSVDGAEIERKEASIKVPGS